jgi:hypothetical protein
MSKKPQGKQPYMPFYCGDWKKDLGVQMLSFHDRHVWFEMLMLMHDAERRGILRVGGRPLTLGQIAKLINLDNQTFLQAFEQIKNHNVCSIDEDGAIYSRSMVKRAETSVKRAISGSLGGNPSLLNQNPKQESYPNADIDIEDGNVNLKKNSPPEYTHLPDAEREKHEQADAMLVAVDDPALAGSSQFINAGRRPMRKFPEIWLTPQELVLVLDEFMSLNIEKRHKSAIFQRVAARIRTKVGSGLSADRVPAFNWLTGFELTNALQGIKAENDMRRSEKYLSNAGQV